MWAVYVHMSVVMDTNCSVPALKKFTFYHKKDLISRILVLLIVVTIATSEKLAWLQSN